MSLLQMLLDLERPRRLLDQHFGLTFSPEDVISLMQPNRQLLSNYYRPWHRREHALNDEVGSTIKINKDKFNINLDVLHFTPDDISVKVSDGYVIIDGKHEEKQDEHGFVSRQFKRRYALPKDCNADALECQLSSDGVLSITAPLKKDSEEGMRSVPIVNTGPVKTQPGDRGEPIGETIANGQ